jgi:hypothetical protein
MSLAPTNGAISVKVNKNVKPPGGEKITPGRKKKVRSDEVQVLLWREGICIHSVLFYSKYGVTLLMFNLSHFVPL